MFGFAKEGMGGGEGGKIEADDVQDEAARKAFDLDPGHDRLKVCCI
jgi:hypothetical protein